MIEQIAVQQPDDYFYAPIASSDSAAIQGVRQLLDPRIHRDAWISAFGVLADLDLVACCILEGTMKDVLRHSRESGNPAVFGDKDTGAPAFAGTACPGPDPARRPARGEKTRQRQPGYLAAGFGAAAAA